MTRAHVVRAILLALAAAALYVGAWALFVPRSMFDSFPGFGRAWLRTFPPYNEHLVRDVGGFNLMMAALFIWAAVTLDRRLVRAAALTSLLFALPHLIFHVFHLGGLTAGDQVAQLGSLALAVVLPLVAVMLVGREQDA